MRFIHRLPILFLATGLLSACETPDPCTEFAAPLGRQNRTCEQKPADKAATAAKPAKYCYSTLGQIECFTEPQSGRGGYTGSYQ